MNTLYDTDFYQWTFHNAELLRQGKLTEVDVQNIAEELESMGKSEKRELINRLAVLIMHLLKWQYQPEKRSHSWIETINEQRRQIILLLEDSPSLKYEIEEKIIRAYNLAITDTEKETGIRKKLLPQTCPYTFDQLKNNNFWPEKKD
ncbi:MAG TPA: DUF29 domain-containing protein [Thermodesulfovibrionia bacterium]|nr:DUF29 domain-containing protein [Thermodesulfovibrionia bacterium]